MAAEQERTLGVPVYVGGVFVLLAAVLFAYLQWSAGRQPKDAALTPEAKAYVRSLALDEVTMQANENYFKQMVVEINGKIGNKGDRPLNTVELFCNFYDSYGQLVLRSRVPIVTSKMGGLKPGEMKSFRLPFDEIPGSWNQAMPSLVIASIGFGS